MKKWINYNLLSFENIKLQMKVILFRRFSQLQFDVNTFS